MKSSPEHPWSVGEVAERFDLPTNVLRHWESMGLLRPERDAAGRRRYGEDEIVRIAIIQRSKLAGMTLEQIAVLLDDSARGRHEVLQRHLDDIDKRMLEMQRSREMTEHALRCRAHDIMACPRFRAGVSDVIAGLKPSRSPIETPA